MEDLSLNIPIVKAVKKTTFCGIISKSHLNLNPEYAPDKSYIRSQSFKDLKRFVPRLMPRKSTFVPTPLKLNENNNINIYKKNENEDEKQLSEDEVKIIDSDSSDSLSSSELNNSSDVEIQNEINKNKNKEKEKDKEKEVDKKISNDNDNLFNNIEKIELNNIENDTDSLNLNDIEEKKNLRAVRRKMSQIKAKAEKIKSKETKDIISDNFKIAFDIGFKKNDEKEVNLAPNLHSSVKFFGENNSNNKQKTKSIFEILSNSKKNDSNNYN